MRLIYVSILSTVLAWAGCTGGVRPDHLAAVRDYESAAGARPSSPQSRPQQASRGRHATATRPARTRYSDIRRTFERDLMELPGDVWADAKRAGRRNTTLAALVAIGLSEIALDAADANQWAGDHYTRRGPQLNKFWDTVGDAGGNPALHFAVTGAAYFTSLARDDEQTYRNAKTMFNALSITGLVTLATKATFRTQSPNGQGWGWASGHTSSSVCFATVAAHQYGPWAGVPLGALATFVAYQRVDARTHDLNDVVAGALIGAAVGHAVATDREPKILTMTVLPHIDPRTGAPGITLYKSW